MSHVFRDISIAFDGKTYVFTPSNRLMRRIDAGLSPNTLLGVIGTMNGQQLPLYDIAYIVSEFIAAGGGKVSEDDVLAELMADLQETQGAGIRPMIEAIASAIAPPGDAEKKSPAPVKAKTGTGARRKR